MFCKFCGKRISTGESVCPHCGHEQGALHGGNAFWDLADKPVPAPRRIESERPQEGTRPRMRWFVPVCAAFAAICLLSFAVIFAANIRTRSAIEEVNGELSGLRSGYNELSTEMSTCLGQLKEEEEPSPEAPPDTEPVRPEAEAELVITKQPTDTLSAIGRKDRLVFSVVAEGTNLIFTWQKLGAGGEWESILFTYGRNNSYGLLIHDYNMSDQGRACSELIADGLTEKSEGEYRCIVSDQAGNEEYTESVFLSFEEEESSSGAGNEAPAAEPVNPPASSWSGGWEPDEEAEPTPDIGNGQTGADGGETEPEDEGND